MANAVSRVQSAITPWGDCGIFRIPVAVAQTWYPGSMVALDASGNAAKCDNTAGLRFDGINSNTVRTQINSDDTLATMALDQSKQIWVERPWRFTMAIAAAVAGDEGKALYARYDNEVSYSQTNSIFVGWVDQVLSATSVLVRPAWSGVAVNPGVAFDGSTLTFVGTGTGTMSVVVPDNLADALSFKEGSNKYLTFVTTNSAERVLFTVAPSLLDSVGLMIGTGEDIVFSWDGTRLNVTQAATNSEIRWGVDGAGIDQRWYGDTASASMLWDQSADKLIFNGVAKIQLQTIAAATGTAIPVTHSGSFPITQNGAETNTLADPTFLGQQIDIFVDTDTSGARVITAASRINQAANTIITLSDVGDFIRLVAITIAGALKWQVVANDGAVLS